MTASPHPEREPGHYGPITPEEAADASRWIADFIVNESTGEVTFTWADPRDAGQLKSVVMPHAVAARMLFKGMHTVLPNYLVKNKPDGILYAWSCLSCDAGSGKLPGGLPDPMDALNATERHSADTGHYKAQIYEVHVDHIDNDPDDEGLDE